MPDFTDEVADPADYLQPDVPGVAANDGGGDASLEPVVNYISALSYTYEPWQVAAFVTAVRTKPFVILAGISGTGKTKLPQLIAQATGAYVEIVPVRPDWTDSSDLLGYERLDGTFVPGHLLNLCRQALAEPERQFFLVLDEMNVARVEYYFAEVLSLMENRERQADGTIRTSPLLRNAPAGEDWWSTTFLPGNVCIVGTVNMDETTHGFSRKVLDRAFVLELSEVDLSDVRRMETEAPLPAPWPVAAWGAAALRLADSPDVEDATVTQVIQALTRANEALSKAQLQVGYRVRDEVALFCLNARDFGEHFVNSEQAVISPLDLCLNMKLLPRIQGGGSLVRAVVEDLAAWTDPASAGEGGSEEPSGFPRTSARVALMRQRLEQTGFTSYWV